MALKWNPTRRSWEDKGKHWDSDWNWNSDWDSGWKDWESNRSSERSGYRKRVASIWGWKLPIEDEVPHLKGIKSFAKLLQGTGKSIIVRFKRENEAPAYYNPRYRVVAVCYGGDWKEPLKKHEWWAEAMVAHEIGHVRFTPELENFSVWNLIEDRRIEESMARLFPKIGEKFRKVAEYALSNCYAGKINKATDLAYPACVAFHWWKAEPTVKGLEKALGKRVTVGKANGHPVSEFLQDLKILVDNALALAQKKEGKELEALYKACRIFQARYFSDESSTIPSLKKFTDGKGKLDTEKVEKIPLPTVDKGKELRPGPVADRKMKDTTAQPDRKREDRMEKFSLGKYNSVKDIGKAFKGNLLVENPEVPSISHGVVRKFVSFSPQLKRSRSYAEEGTRMNMRRYVGGYDDIFLSPKKALEPIHIDVVVDGSGSMYKIEYLGEGEEKAYVRKTLRLLQEAEKISTLRFRAMMTSTRLNKPLFFKGEYDGVWSDTTFSFRPAGDENFKSAVPYLQSKVVLVITDGCFVLSRDVEAIKDLAKKKTLIGLYIQGEHGYPPEEVKEYMSNFHRFLYIKDESHLWKLGKVLARFIH